MRTPNQPPSKPLTRRASVGGRAAKAATSSGVRPEAAAAATSIDCSSKAIRSGSTTACAKGRGGASASWVACYCSCTAASLLEAVPAAAAAVVPAVAAACPAAISAPPKQAAAGCSLPLGSAAPSTRTVGASDGSRCCCCCFCSGGRCWGCACLRRCRRLAAGRCHWGSQLAAAAAALAPAALLLPHCCCQLAAGCHWLASQLHSCGLPALSAPSAPVSVSAVMTVVPARLPPDLPRCRLAPAAALHSGSSPSAAAF